MGMISAPGKASFACTQAAASPVAAVSSNRAGMEAFFATLGVEYVQSGKYKDNRASDDARLAANQFDVIRKAYLHCSDIRETDPGKELLEACLTSVPPIMNRGVIDGIAICFINDLVGYGCFVQHDLAEGTHIGMYAGIVSEASYANTSSTYIMATNPWYAMIPANARLGIIDVPEPWPKMVADAGRAGNELRFANHVDAGALLMGTPAKAANIDIKSFFHYRQDVDGIRGLFHVVFVAARNIQAGEELRYDYGSDYWEKLGAVPANSSVFRLQNDRLAEVPVTI